MKWYIGQPIVAITNSKCGNIKKGQEFTIKGIVQCSCKCGGSLINVGMQAPFSPSTCYRCGLNVTEKTTVRWKHERLFAPLDVDISELTDILKEPIKEYVEK